LSLAPTLLLINIQGYHLGPRFIKLINTVAIDEADLKQLGKAAALLARAEGLDAHARAVEKRLKPD